MAKERRGRKQNVIVQWWMIPIIGFMVSVGISAWTGIGWAITTHYVQSLRSEAQCMLVMFTLIMMTIGAIAPISFNRIQRVASGAAAALTALLATPFGVMIARL